MHSDYCSTKNKHQYVMKWKYHTYTVSLTLSRWKCTIHAPYWNNSAGSSITHVHYANASRKDKTTFLPKTIKRRDVTQSRSQSQFENHSMADRARNGENWTRFTLCLCDADTVNIRRLIVNIIIKLQCSGWEIKIIGEWRVQYLLYSTQISWLHRRRRRGGHGGTCPLKFGQNIFRAIIM